MVAGKRGRPPKSRKVNLDFSDIEVRKPIEDGWHNFRVSSVEKGTGPNGDYLKVTSVVASGKGEGGTSVNTHSLSAQSLWKLAEFLDALGFDVSGSLQLDPDELIDLTFVGKVVNEEYEGRDIPKIKSYKADSESEELETEADDESSEEDDESEEETAEEDDENIEISEEDINDMSAEELETLLHEMEVKAKLVGSVGMKRKQTIAALKKAGHL